ncbi:single-stranded DNA-binding protein [Arthrobacter sp. B6]|uniref:single-stranded DNA-binding protein n=1 Tax=Arthrobacter sp. B6 TaxID=1570137 RepID=UPI00082D6220|nr:single-stranded DNA-binding protein [Arthrobacter sp. B6]
MTDIITIRGFVATDVTTSTTTTGIGTASFRLGSPSRHFDKASGTWIEDNMNWFTVQGYRQLAGNMGCSIKKGQRVIVVGRLKLASWERDGRIYHKAEITADAVGHDLKWGSANYIRTPKNELPDSETSARSGSDGYDPAGVDSGPDDYPEEDGTPEDIVFEDATGSYVSVDTETGELAGAAT